MLVLTGHKEIEARKWMGEALEEARKATCLRARCGSVVVLRGEVIGRGFNSPPGNLESQRRCNCEKSKYHVRVTDKTCCIHAEQRAISDALSRVTMYKLTSGSALYFMRADESGIETRAGNPYCTICSKAALDAGINRFVLLRPEGICSYDTEEYNELSFGYRGD